MGLFIRASLPVMLAAGLLTHAYPCLSQPSRFNTDAASEVAKRAQAGTLVVVGEIHGTKETPQFVGDIVEALPSDREWIVALELPRQLQPSLDRYLSSKVSRNEFAEQKELKARSSFGMFTSSTMQLIDRLKIKIDSGSPGKVYFYDDLRAEPAKRDTAMASYLLDLSKIHPRASIVALTGNAHGDRGNKDSMASRLTSSNTFSVIVMATSGGEFWGCSMREGQQACGAQRLPSPSALCPADGRMALTTPDKQPKLEGRYSALACLPSFTAAKPLQSEH